MKLLNDRLKMAAALSLMTSLLGAPAAFSQPANEPAAPEAPAFEKVADAPMAELNEEEAKIVRALIGDANLLGRQALDLSDGAEPQSLRHIRVLVNQELTHLFGGGKAEKTVLENSLNQTETCVRGGKLIGTGEGRATLVRTSKTQAEVDAVETAKLVVSNCQHESGVTFQGELEGKGTQRGTLARPKREDDWDHDFFGPRKYSIDYTILVNGNLNANLATRPGKAYGIRFQDFEVFFNFNEQDAEEEGSLWWDPLGGKVYDNAMDFYTNLLSCRGSLEIDGTVYSCRSILKFGLDHTIRTKTAE